MLCYRNSRSTLQGTQSTSIDIVPLYILNSGASKPSLPHRNDDDCFCLIIDLAEVSSRDCSRPGRSRNLTQRLWNRPKVLRTPVDFKDTSLMTRNVSEASRADTKVLHNRYCLSKISPCSCSFVQAASICTKRSSQNASLCRKTCSGYTGYRRQVIVVLSHVSNI